MGLTRSSWLEKKSPAPNPQTREMIMVIKGIPETAGPCGTEAVAAASLVIQTLLSKSNFFGTENL